MKLRQKFVVAIFLYPLAMGIPKFEPFPTEMIHARAVDLSIPESIQILGSTRDETLIDLDQNESGSFVITGTTDGEIDGNPNRQLDAFVAKFDSDGKKLWLVRFGTPQDDYATAVVIDKSGTVWVSGDTYGGMEGNVNKGERDSFLAKFSTDGVQQWIVHISTNVIERARGLAVDSRGIATVVGTTYGEFPGFSNFGKAREAWITQIDGAGKQLWLKQFGSEKADTIVDVQVDANGNSTFCGYTDGVLGDLSYGGRDAFVGAFDSSGTRGWTYQFGTTGTDICYGLTVSGEGEIISVGSTSGSIGSQTNLGGLDGWILKIDRGGSFRWATQIGGTGDEGLAKVAVNRAGQVIVGGSIFGSIGTSVTSGSVDAILLVTDKNGKVATTSQFGTSSADGVAGLAILDSQKILVAGTSGGGIFGSTGIGELDIFIARFSAVGAESDIIMQRTFKCRKGGLIKTFTKLRVVCPVGYKLIK